MVPLSQRSGVLEWCTGTVPIGEFLVNNENGAHKRYRPKDFSALQCQKKMMVSDTQKYELLQDCVLAYEKWQLSTSIEYREFYEVINDTK